MTTKNSNSLGNSSTRFRQRHHDFDDLEPVIGSSGTPPVDIVSDSIIGDHPHVGRDAPVAPETVEFAVLQNVEQLA